MTATERERERSAHGDGLAQGWRVLEHDPVAAAHQAEEALKTAPASAQAVLLLAAARRRLDDTEGARALLAPIMRQRPRSALAWFEWGQLLSETDEAADAVAALEQSVALAPNFAGAWRSLGDLLMVLGSGVSAGQAYACAARAGVRDSALGAAAAALADGRTAEAEHQLLQHLRQHPADLRAQHLLAEAAMRMGRVIEAEAILRRCLRAAPGFAEARHSLAILLCGLLKYEPAAPLLRQLLDAMPHQPSLRALLAICLEKTGDFQAAIGQYEAMLAASPSWRKIWLKYGHALKTLGREAGAARALRTCIALAPQDSAAAFLSLGDLKTVRVTEAEMDAMRGLLAGGTTDADAAAQLHYVLGHALDQRGAHDDAFRHFSKGAALRRAKVTYDAEALNDFVAAAKSVFTAPFFTSRQGGGCASPAPIFVVGLPRSGTTLVEQILASHPQVEGTSELEEIGVIASELRHGRPASELPAILSRLDGTSMTQLGERYLQNTQQFRRLGRARFIDKMPENFLHVGLIHAILPNARIVDVRRAPMAAGWALFRQYFRPQENGPNYSYDLPEIGRYYCGYSALMAHFAAVLPAVVHRVQYEDLVDDTETQVRALLNHCGLPFDEACLRFWETARPVQTPSAQQVRRPIFRNGLEAWRNYEPWLGPLREALDSQ